MTKCSITGPQDLKWRLLEKERRIQSIPEQAETRRRCAARWILAISEQAKTPRRTVDDTRRVVLVDNPVDSAVPRHLPDDVGRLVQVLPL
jgi:hypothetical protein